jgi:hypothetical protein
MGGGGSWLQAPFVFTPDLAYVMGGKDSANYRKFVELCCTCYQILRKNANMYSLDRITAAAKGPLRGLCVPFATLAAASLRRVGRTCLRLLSAPASHLGSSRCSR